MIAEVDEENVALKKDTVTLIDDRQDGESSYLQLSNFAVFENRENHKFELYLTRLGATFGVRTPTSIACMSLSRRH